MNNILITTGNEPYAYKLFCYHGSSKFGKNILCIDAGSLFVKEHIRFIITFQEIKII